MNLQIVSTGTQDFLWYAREYYAVNYRSDEAGEITTVESQLFWGLFSANAIELDENGKVPAGVALALPQSLVNFVPPPRRIPPDFPTRSQWEAIGVFELSDVEHLDLDWLVSEFSGTLSEADVRDQLETLLFMSVLTLDYPLAVALRNQDVGTPRTLVDVALMAPFYIELLLISHKGPRDTQGLWLHIVRSAGQFVPARPDASIESLSWGPDEETLFDSMIHWSRRHQFGSSQQQESARQIQNALSVMKGYTELARAYEEARFSHFLNRYESFKGHLHGWVDSAEPPTPRDVIQRVGEALEGMRPEDVDEIRFALGGGENRVLEWATGGQLYNVQDVVDEIQEVVRLDDVPSGGLAGAYAAVSEAAVANAEPSLNSYHGQALLLRAQSSVSRILVSDIPASANVLVEMSSLPDLGELAGVSLANMVVDPELAADVVNFSDPGRHYVSLQPNPTTHPDLLFSFQTPAGAEMVDAYVEQFLEPFLALNPAPSFGRETFRDPAAFLNALPILLLRAIPAAVNRARIATGASAHALRLGLRAAQGAQFPTGATFHFDVFHPDGIEVDGPHVLGAAVTQVNDLSGNGLHAQSSEAPDPVLTGPFPSAAGEALAPAASSSRMAHRFSAGRALGECTLVAWTVAPRATGERLVTPFLMRNNSGWALMGIRVKNGTNQLLDGSGHASDATGVGPGYGTGATDEWLVTAIRRWIRDDGRVDYKVFVIGGSDTETAQHRTSSGGAFLLNNQAVDPNFNASFKGMRLSSNSGDVIGGGFLYEDRLESDELDEVVVAAAARLGEARGQQVAALLGVTSLGVNLLEDVSLLGPDAALDGVASTFVLETTRGLNEEADELYIAGNLEGAKAGYLRVVDMHRSRQTLGKFYERLDVVHAHLRLEIADGRSPSLYDYTVETPGGGSFSFLGYRPVNTSEVDTSSATAETQAGALLSTDQVDEGLLKAELLHAYAQVKAIEEGLNFLGFPFDYMPSWSYETLVAAARSLTERVETLQGRNLSFVEGAAQKSTQLQNAVRAREAANHEEDMAQSVLDEANANLTQAKAAHERAKKAQAARILAGVGLGVAGAVSAVATGGISLSVAAAAGFASAAGSAGSAAAGIQRVVNGVKQAKEQKETAEDVVDLRTKEMAVASLQAEHAAGLVTFLEDARVTADAYIELAVTVEQIARRLMRRAHQLAWLAERALMREELVMRRLIDLKYEDRYRPTQRFYSASLLRYSIAQMEAARLVEARAPRSLIKKVASLSLVDPLGLLELRRSGTSAIRLGLRWFDEQMPGTYLRQIERVEVQIDGTSGSTFEATLSAVGGGWVRVPNTEAYRRLGAAVDPYYVPDPENPQNPDNHTLNPDPNRQMAPFVMVQSTHTPGQAVISDYHLGQDAAVVTPSSESTRPLQHHGVDTLWLLELSPESLGERDKITDVRLSFFFTAAYDVSLQERQLARWKVEGTPRVMSQRMSTSNPDSLFDSRHGTQSLYNGVAAHFAFAFPSHVVNNLLEVAVVCQGLPGGVPFRVAIGDEPVWQDAVTDREGAAYSSANETSLYLDDDGVVSGLPGGTLAVAASDPADAHLTPLLTALSPSTEEEVTVRLYLDARDPTLPDELRRQGDDGELVTIKREALALENGQAILNKANVALEFEFDLEIGGVLQCVRGPAERLRFTRDATTLTVLIDGQSSVKVYTTASVFWVTWREVGDDLELTLNGQRRIVKMSSSAVDLFELHGDGVVLMNLQRDDPEKGFITVQWDEFILQNASVQLVDLPLLRLDALLDVAVTAIHSSPTVF